MTENNLSSRRETSPSPAILLLSEVDSTNRFLRDRAREALLPDGQAVLAAAQTGGRGRLGRSFCSPPGTGMYLSVFYRTRDAAEAMALTPLCACAVCAVLEEDGLTPRIKWVNDIWLDGKKVCGILCEKAEGGAVCGIGLNLAVPEGGFPEELRGIAGALENGAEALPTAVRVLEKLDFWRRSAAEALPYYRERMFLTGRTVTLPEGVPARVLGVSERFGLRVLLPSGEERELISGEVTLHGRI